MTSFSQIFKHFRVNFATKERRRFFCPGNYEFRPVFHYKKFRFDVSTNCCGSERAFTYVATLEGYRCGSNFSPTPAFSRVRFWGASLLGSRRGIRKSLYPLFRIHDDGSLSLSPPLFRLRHGTTVARQSALPFFRKIRLFCHHIRRLTEWKLAEFYVCNYGVDSYSAYQGCKDY